MSWWKVHFDLSHVSITKPCYLATITAIRYKMSRIRSHRWVCRLWYAECLRSCLTALNASPPLVCSLSLVVACPRCSESTHTLRTDTRLGERSLQRHASSKGSGRRHRKHSGSTALDGEAAHRIHSPVAASHFFEDLVIEYLGHQTPFTSWHRHLLHQVVIARGHCVDQGLQHTSSSSPSRLRHPNRSSFEYRSTCRSSSA